MSKRIFSFLSDNGGFNGTNFYKFQKSPDKVPKIDKFHKPFLKISFILAFLKCRERAIVIYRGIENSGQFINRRRNEFLK